MTNPANAASREARAKAIARRHGIDPSDKPIIAAMLECADEAASQPREGDGDERLIVFADDMVECKLPEYGQGYFCTPDAFQPLATLHDTAPTDQAQRGGEQLYRPGKLMSLAQSGDAS